MALRHARDVPGVESAAVVLDGKKQLVPLDAACDPNLGGVAVSHRVEGKFADYTENGVQDILREPFAWNAEAYGEPDAAIPAEGYRLSVGDSGIRVASSSPAGAFYAGETLRQLRGADVREPIVTDDCTGVQIR